MTTKLESVTDEVANIVRQLLEEKFGDTIVFDPIEVKPEIDHDGDEYLDIFIIYDGDYKKLDPGWSSGLPMLLRPGLVDLGIASIPCHSFVPKDEWKEVFKEKHPKAYEPSSPY